MFDEDQKLPHHYHRTKYESEKLARDEVKTKPLVFRPGSCSATPRPARWTRSTARTTSSSCSSGCATRCRSGSRSPGPEGGQTNIVPVDFVAKAMDHIAHLPDDELPGDTFHLANPEPMTVGQALNAFAKAGARAAVRDARGQPT